MNVVVYFQTLFQAASGPIDYARPGQFRADLRTEFEARCRDGACLGAR